MDSDYSEIEESYERNSEEKEFIYESKYPYRARRNGPRGGKSSFLPGSTHQPSPEEIQYLEAAEYGDIPTVGRLVKESKTLNINCVDYMGQNALQLACGNEHLEIVDILIKQPAMARIGDALLLAISRGFLRITETILNHSSFNMHDRLTRSPSEQQALHEDKDFYAYDDNGTRFSPDITPIILAAQYQEFDIVHELLRRGAKIDHPHDYRCQCTSCSERKTSDSLSYCLSRLNAYRGLASPAYLALSSPYPARQAFKLSHELKKLSAIEKEFKIATTLSKSLKTVLHVQDNKSQRHYLYRFSYVRNVKGYNIGESFLKLVYIHCSYLKNDYLKLAQQCNDFVERLLDVCHNTEEVDVMLNGHKVVKEESLEEERSCSWSTDCTGDTESNPRLRQLRMAIKYDVKKFVAHPYCQQKVIEIWYKGYEWLIRLSILHKIAWGATVSFLMPLFALTYIVAPCSRVGKLIQSPFCKFVTQAIAYTQFVLLLVFNCLDRVEGFKDYSSTMFLVHRSQEHGRYTQFNWCEVLLMIFIAGLLWNEVKELWGEGARSYMTKLWNMVDSMMILILIASFTCRAIAYNHAARGQEWWDSQFGANATVMVYEPSNGTLLFNGERIDMKVPEWAGYYAYCRTSRKFWYGSDPQLIAEALYSLGIVLSFSRISYILEVNDKFGPLQISLARTVGDILKWCGIFFMIFGAFLLGLFNLYSYYGEKEAKESKAFTTLEETFITLFWSMFGLSDFHVVEVKYNHPFTRIIGYQLFGAYSIITVIIMLNMLIAMINSSYSEVEGDSDVEWKFSRAELMLSYFEKGNTLPVPYNLLPLPKVIFYIIASMINKARVKKNGFSRRSNGITKKTSSGESIDMVENPVPSSFKSSKSNSFKSTMSRIVKRYVIKAQVDKARDAEITEAELQEIKHDISSLRYEMIGSTTRTEESVKEILSLLQSKDITNPEIGGKKLELVKTSPVTFDRKKEHGHETDLNVT